MKPAILPLLCSLIALRSQKAIVTIILFIASMLSPQTRADRPEYVQATRVEYTFSNSFLHPDGDRAVVVLMKQDESKHFSSIRITAFGKTCEVAKPILDGLDNYTCSGLTMMTGFDSELQSQAIYLRLSMAVFEQAGLTAVIVFPQNGELILRKQKK